MAEAGQAESFADPGLLLGRWARSSSCSNEFKDFLCSLGVADERATSEALEQQILIFTSATKDRLRLVQQHSWRDGLQVEYGMALNGEFQRRPPQVPCIGGTTANDESEWRHYWTSEGFCTEQMISVQGESLLLRVRSSFVTANELRMDYFLCQMPAGEVRKQTSRFFERSPFLTTWKAAACQFFSGTDVEFNLKTCILWLERAKAAGAHLVVMPENSNRDRTYFKDGKPSRELCWEHSETLDGSFVRGICRACRDIGIWASLGVDLRGRQKPTVHIGILLIAPTGKIVGAVKKHVLWDYEYTLFEPGSEPYQVFDTELGRLGVLCCADGIVPEAARVLCLKGAQVLLNSLNSRGPDEMRLHIPLRAIENAVWHVASNTVGNPNTAGLLWPWTGGSEVCDPSGVRVVASEEHDDMVVAEVTPWQSELKETSWVQDLWACRRPELYELMCEPLESVPAAVMYGPAPSEALPFEGPACLKVAMMQLSATHTRQCTEWMTQRQISYAARRGAVLGVLPALWCFRRDEVQKDPAEAAAYSNQILKKLQGWCKDSNFNLCCSLVEEEAGSRFHTAYLVGADGSVLLRYRKTHLNRAEGSWASRGDSIVVESLPGLGRVAVLIADEVWSPELSRCIALQAAEVVLHPADWDRVEAAEMAATERATENRFHLVSVNRLDSPGRIGSQTTLAGEYIGGEPIPLMRYGQGIWCRFGVEELIVVDLLRRQPHCKMMGDHLDVLRKRWPQLCTVCREPQRRLPCWREITDVRPGHFPDEVRHSLQDRGLDKSSSLRCRFADDFGDS